MFDHFSLARKYIRKALLKPVAFTLASYYILKRKLSINVSLKKSLHNFYEGFEHIRL